VPQSRSGRSGNDTNIALTGSNLTVQHARVCYTKCAIPAHALIEINKKLQRAEHILGSRQLYSY
jgi:hypothetical protein